MKKLLLFIILPILLLSFATIQDNNIATVEQEQGIATFIKCKPVAKYTYLGSIKKTVAWTGKPDEMYNSMIKKCKKEYPQANGLIFTGVDMDKADCIKFE